MSNRKLYLNLKQSFLELFRTRAYYLKEMTSKWSIFDKPYLEEDYRAMHLRLPKPRWSSGRLDSTKPVPMKRWTFQWGPPDCWIDIANPDCGEPFVLGATMWSIPPHSKQTRVIFSATSSDPTKVWLTKIVPDVMGLAADLHFATLPEWEGTVTICVTASIEGRLIKEYTIVAPAQMGNDISLQGILQGNFLDPSKLSYGMPQIFNPYGAKGNIEYYSGVSGGKQAIFNGASNRLNLDIGTQDTSTPFNNESINPSRGMNCGCVDVTVTCQCDDSGIFWDDATSADTVARGASCTVAILDTLGKGWTYIWGVSGTGFTLDNVITGEGELTNTLRADASACGTATVTVTGCEGNVVTGYVRCTTGVWVTDAGIVTCPWSFVGTGSPYTWGKWRITQSLWVCLSGGGGCVTPAYCATHPVSSCRPGGSMNCDNAPCSNGCNGADCDVFGTMHCTPCAQPLPQKNGVMGLQDCGCAQRSCAAGEVNCQRYIAVLRNWKAEVWSCA